MFDQKVDVQSKYDFQHRKESIPMLQKDTDCNNEFMESKVNEDVKAEGSVAVGDYVVFEDIHQIKLGANGILPENKEDNFLLLPPKKFECVKCEYKTHKKGALKEHVGHVFD